MFVGLMKDGWGVIGRQWEVQPCVSNNDQRHDQAWWKGWKRWGGWRDNKVKGRKDWTSLGRGFHSG